MSGEGTLAARPLGMPDAREPGPAARPYVVGKLGVDGRWGVLLCVPVAGALPIEVMLDADAADTLACELLEYAMLVRNRRGLSPRDRDV